MRGRIETLQVVRFAAASLVIVHHAWQTMVSDPDPAVLGNLGGLGVDIFFVLSGYIMAVSASRSTPMEFIARRLGRIVPLYYLLTLAFMGVLMLGRAFTAGPVLTSFLFVPVPGATPYLNVAWTLDYEMLFYAGFALVLAFPKRGMVAVLGALAMTLLGRTLFGGPVFNFVGNPIILEFLAGVLVAQLPARKGVAGLALACGVAGLLLLALMAPPGIGWRRTLLTSLPCAALIYGAPILSARGAVWRRLVYLGDASYAAYLVHQFPLTLAKPLAPLIPAPVGLVAVVAASWGLAVLVHEAVERPILQYLRRPRPVLAAA